MVRIYSRCVHSKKVVCTLRHPDGNWKMRIALEVVMTGVFPDSEILARLVCLLRLVVVEVVQAEVGVIAVGKAWSS